MRKELLKQKALIHKSVWKFKAMKHRSLIRVWFLRGWRPRQPLALATTPAIKYGMLATFLCLQVAAYSSDLTKAFKYLNTGDYTNAQKYLLEVVAEDPQNPAANFGMSKFYFLKDNKLYNLDSANAYIKKAISKVPLNPDDKQTKKYLTLGVRDYTIKALQQDINQRAYSVAETQHTFESYQFYIDNYTDSGLIVRSVNMRNQLAYIRARGKNDPWALDTFIKTYPKADQVPEAKELFQKLLYEQTTADKTYTSYKKYLDLYPTGAFVKEAQKHYEELLLEYYNNRRDLEGYKEFESKYKTHPAFNAVQDSIYAIVTRPNTIDAFRTFVMNYINNRNVHQAWLKLYALSTAEATEQAYRKFLDDYNDFPDKPKVYHDIELSKLNLQPFKQDEKFGYAFAKDTSPDSLTLVIPVQYDEATAFKCGVAAVRNQPCTDARCSYFYIDKDNKKVFGDKQFNYTGDFDNGFAIVGIGDCDVDSCKYGMIDKLGNWTILPIYDDFEDPTSGLYEVARDSLHGFINQQGNAVISLKYSNAVPFSEGVAAVALDTSWFFIDTQGKQLFFDNFHDVSNFKDSLCAVSRDGENWGYIDRSGNFVIEPLYEDAGDFENGIAIVSKKEKDLKHKGLYISQRYKIDKTGKVLEKLLAPKEASKKGKKKRGKG
jgi:hypothetical protein